MIVLFFTSLLSNAISAEEQFFLIRAKQEENIYVRKSALQSFSLISTAGRVLSKLTSSMKDDKQSTVNHHDSSFTNISLQINSLIKRISKNGHLVVLCFTDRGTLIELGTLPVRPRRQKKTKKTQHSGTWFYANQLDEQNEHSSLPVLLHGLIVRQFGTTHIAALVRAAAIRLHPSS